MKKYLPLATASILAMLYSGMVVASTPLSLQLPLPADFSKHDQFDDIEKHVPKHAPAPRSKPNPHHQQGEIKKAKAMLKEIHLKAPERVRRHALPAVDSHVGISMEGFLAKTSGKADSMFRVTHLTNESTPTETVQDRTTLPNGKASWGWATTLDYRLESGSDVSLSYRLLNEKSDKVTTAYSSLGQIQAGTGGYYYTSINDFSYIEPQGYSSLVIGGQGATGKALAYLVATDTLTEIGSLSYQQANVNWGHFFALNSAFSLHPHVGLAWRRIGYKDRMTFTSIGARSGTAPVSGTDYIDAGKQIAHPGSSGKTIKLDGIVLTEVATGADLYAYSDTVSSHSVYFDTDFAAETYKIIDNSAYDTTLSTLLPSYTSRFSGVGPSIGLDGDYAFGSHLSMTAGLSMAMPYAKLKTHGYTTDFTIRDMQSGGDTTTPSGDTLQTNVNIQAESGDRTAFSFSSHRMIPEMELNIGFRYSAHTKQQSRAGTYLNQLVPEEMSEYYVELGYRAIKDWSAVKNIDLATDTLTGSRNVTNQGVYLKLGVDF